MKKRDKIFITQEPLGEETMKCPFQSDDYNCAMKTGLLCMFGVTNKDRKVPVSCPLTLKEITITLHEDYEDVY